MNREPQQSVCMTREPQQSDTYAHTHTCTLTTQGGAWTYQNCACLNLDAVKVPLTNAEQKRSLIQNKTLW